MGTWREGATPGDGFISRLTAEGRVVDLRWIAGLQNPKGLALANGRLYAADDAELIEIDPAAGTIVARYAPPDGPGGFNDCTAAPDGTVYVFSRRLAAVFRLRGGRFEAWAKVDLAQTGAPGDVGGQRTDWTKGEILRVSADGVPSLLLTLKQGAADHTYVIDRGLLVVPLVLDGAVRAYRWTPDGR